MLTALEEFLRSLYGCQPADEPLSSETPSTPPEAVQPEEDHSLASLDLLRDATAARTDASLVSRTSNGSSSSSLADDWIVSDTPAGFGSDLSLDGRSCSLSERLADGVSSADESREPFSAEAWSRGTALTDPVSGKPLEPVGIQQPFKANRSPPPSPSPTKVPNAITEKRASLTAYDLISNRATRAPLSPAALFEKEARAEVLREQPAASLQDISAAVQQRWKNLREEDRKK